MKKLQTLSTSIPLDSEKSETLDVEGTGWRANQQLVRMCTFWTSLIPSCQWWRGFSKQSHPLPKPVKLLSTSEAHKMARLNCTTAHTSCSSFSRLRALLRINELACRYSVRDTWHQWWLAVLWVHQRRYCRLQNCCCFCLSPTHPEHLQHLRFLHKNHLNHLRVRSCVLHISCLAISFSAVLPWSCEILSYKTTWRLWEIYGNLFAKPRSIYLVVNENIVLACAAKKVKSSFQPLDSTHVCFARGAKGIGCRCLNP